MRHNLVNAHCFALAWPIGLMPVFRSPLIFLAPRRVKNECPSISSVTGSTTSNHSLLTHPFLSACYFLAFLLYRVHAFGVSLHLVRISLCCALLFMNFAVHLCSVSREISLIIGLLVDKVRICLGIEVKRSHW